MGIPIISALYNETGVFFMGVFSLFYSSFQYTIGIGLYTGIKKDNLKKLILNPLLLASIIMIFLFITQIKLPMIVVLTLSHIGKMCTPLSMLVIGGMISRYSIREIFVGKYKYLILILRLVIIPLTAIFVFKVLEIDSFVSIILSIVLALPSSSTSAVIAHKYGKEPIFASQTVVLSTLLYLLIMPLITSLINNIWSF